MPFMLAVTVLTVQCRGQCGAMLHTAAVFLDVGSVKIEARFTHLAVPVLSYFVCVCSCCDTWVIWSSHG